MAKQVRTNSGTPKSQKNSQFLTLDSRISAEGCFEHEKIAKNHEFLTFFGDSQIQQEKSFEQIDVECWLSGNAGGKVDVRSSLHARTLPLTTRNGS